MVFLPVWQGETASAQKIEFATLGRQTVERRLHQLTSKNAERQKNLEQLFVEAGCEGERLVAQKIKGSRLPNLVCTLPGATSSIIVVGAHYDKVDAGEGAVDNWSGASLLPTLYESIRNHPRKHTFVFVGFTDEEKGLKGSTSFAKQVNSSDDNKPLAMVNLDTLGLSPTKVWYSRADPKLADLLIQLSRALGLPLEGVNVERVGSTDSEPFRQLKIPSMTIHSLTQETLKILHSRRDTLAVIKFDDYYSTYRLLAAYLVLLDSQIE